MKEMEKKGNHLSSTCDSHGKETRQLEEKDCWVKQRFALIHNKYISTSTICQFTDMYSCEREATNFDQFQQEKPF